MPNTKKSIIRPLLSLQSMNLMPRNGTPCSQIVQAIQAVLESPHTRRSGWRMRTDADPQSIALPHRAAPLSLGGEKRNLLPLRNGDKSDGAYSQLLGRWNMRSGLGLSGAGHRGRLTASDVSVRLLSFQAAYDTARETRPLSDAWP